MAGKRLVKCIVDIDLTARRLLLISVVRPTLEYGSEVWEGNKAQAAALESVMIGGAKRILGCSSRTCNEAVRGDMGLDSLQGRRDKAKLKWWYKVATMPEHWYSRKLFVQEWNVKPRRGRQRKYWCKVVDHLFSSLGQLFGAHSAYTRTLFRTFGVHSAYMRQENTPCLHPLTSEAFRVQAEVACPLSKQ